MTLQLTKEEYTRLQKQYKSTKKRSHSIGTRCSHKRELEILAAIKEDRSASSIKRDFRTSCATIIRIQKEHELWGV